MNTLLEEIERCRNCQAELPNEPRPVLRAHEDSKIVLIGQAPGRVVHETGIPWNDRSGDNLRKWMNLDREQFYDTEKMSIIPMGFCYPGTGDSGDFPPMKRCAPDWHGELFRLLPKVELVLLVGQYAQKYYLGKSCKRNLTETVRNYQDYLPRYLPLPHPSPRNIRWQQKNPWFVHEIVPMLREEVKRLYVG
ncbi:MAG: uracil-DNA glycosylase family protein [Bacteroidetes bacterium]|nr:MAG: uracil-DNA glycosylase family protein [Bacteroidota bacterium]